MAEPLSWYCRGCWEQKRIPVALGGVLSLPYQAVGLRRSRMNPNTCTMCELMFTRVFRARQVKIEATVMFADLRGYTGLSQTLTPEAMSRLLDAFYDVCAGAIWEFDGLLNKAIGDAVLAVFNFPIPIEDHARRAVLAARAIQERCKAMRAELAETFGLDGSELGVGIGIDSGEVNFGEFGRSHKDITAIGTVVNTASRAQSAAAAGSILVTRSVRERSGVIEGAGEVFSLKGFAEPVELFAG